jgi:hypothetical protein
MREEKKEAGGEAALAEARWALADVADAARPRVRALLERHPELSEFELMDLVDGSIREAERRLGSRRLATDGYLARRAVALRGGEGAGDVGR